MSEDTVTIEVDGKTLEAHKGQMLIEVTDRNNIYVPRFCYHHKLSVAANCRMCLVEVEKAPKPLPACATPVADGMVVRTRSDYAIAAQKSVMEFLLINHPLDCPICDQGGECELQDLAMGYGEDVSRYQEAKRVVKDKDIGPLVHTDLTRCIHCTRCVRFGEEIAGLRELGATGRGEDMEIGTYIEKSMESELSGNVIDLCPVGALVSKPFLFKARSWEMQQRTGIAPHDCVGSNVEFHTRNNRVLRVVPAANEAINEVWLSDRDRFSYEGLYADERLLQPMLKKEGKWVDVDWSEALTAVEQGLNEVRRTHGGNRIGTLASPSVTTEEYYLLQKLMRGIGCSNIDHRLRQRDFSRPDMDGPFPWLGQAISDIENQHDFLIIGANPRQETPLINHRIRKACLKGGRVMVIDTMDHEFNYDLETRLVCEPAELAHNVAAVLKAAMEIRGGMTNGDDAFLHGVEVTDQHRSIATRLCESGAATLLLGESVTAHVDRALITGLAARLADVSGSRQGFLSAGANAAGAWLSGVVPHRGAFMKDCQGPALNTNEMFENGLQAWVLYHLEPEQDCLASELARSALEQAGFVVAFTAFKTPGLESIADVLLPIALYAENEGSFINVEGRVQTFTQAVKPPGEVRTGWRVLRKLGNLFALDGFEYQAIDQLQDEIMPAIKAITPAHGDFATIRGQAAEVENTAEPIRYRHMYAIDPLVRRGQALATFRQRQERNIP